MKPNENVMQDGTTGWETSHLLHMHDYMHAELHAEFKEYASSVANQRTEFMIVQKLGRNTEHVLFLKYQWFSRPNVKSVHELL